ncbi:threonine synthase [Heterostelium album PN500]|uniref:threonine synthase n=1 Tax=Heterostelium pallidum (strain ATCC 26659 / Pp 5 / PN500) TaxID=670386 RepID=D3BUK1_HETP5|nr:threonine synthase [Heterostelium album PN500]EFA74789.1 threonine synthase [Heterostelium album PN500]|eukprot:XP_020426923.1 threonine synthase [Heterostelium album PN500]
MKYKSTRGKINGLTFVDAVKMGLADDGGLLIPQSIPKLSSETLESWRNKSFQELSFEILSLYIDRSDIPAADLKALIERAYSTFSDTKITPLHRLSPSGNTLVLELFHGPTFSFKDVALQLLGNLFEYVLSEPMTVVAATSGDTGSAAIAGLRARQNLSLFVLYPKGRISAVQELQMVTVNDDNIHPIAVTNSNFDDCQSLVKTLMNDQAFKHSQRLGVVNSINWARILAQMVYYFHAYFQSGAKSVTFSVPTGNFGDILAGFYASKMGLPVDNLIVSTNDNDILDRFFREGRYVKPASVVPTVAPAMDINVASNFERYLYYLFNEDSDRLVKFMNEFNSQGTATINQEQLDQTKADRFLSAHVGQQEIVETIASYHQTLNYTLDPHTAIGLAAAKHHGLTNYSHYNQNSNDHVLICLSTAHPAKFSETVDRAINSKQSVEQQFEPTRKLLEQQSSNNLNRFEMSLDINQLKQYILKHNK